MLSLAGYLCDRPDWSQLAARFLLAMAWTPNWFEGPQACFPGSDWHHVCFVESHNLLAAAFALQFVGDVLTDEGRQLVWRRVEEAWTLVDAKCVEPGYRWYMNQGIVFNSIRLAGAAALWRESKESRYRSQVEIAFRDHSQVLDNYLAADGHCCEGPHYFSYSMNAAMSAWMAYAAFQQKPLKEVLPKKFIQSGAYLEIMSSVLQPTGFHLPICASECEAWPLSVLSTLESDATATFLKHRWDTQFQKQKFTAWDVCSLLPMRRRAKTTTKPVVHPGILGMASGLGSVRWSTPTPGQLLLTAERPSTGHYHYDRGGLLLEAAGRLLLVDPGMTNYSFPRCASMREPDWHNTAHPVGMRMRCHNRPEEFDME